MELSRILELIAEPAKLKQKITAEKAPVDSAVKLFDITKHDVMSKTKRPEKLVTRTVLEDGVTRKITEYQDVARIAMPIQKFIVDMRVNFLCANPIILNSNPATELEENLVEILKKTWDDNKLDYDTKELASRLMSDTEVAELWYTEEVDKSHWAGTPNEGKTRRTRMKILTSDDGNALYPSYDQYGDMVAFGRSYKVKNEDGKEIEHFDLYTAEKNYFFEIDGAEIKQSKNPEPNPNKKIPIIYYSQPKVEWSDVQQIIDQKEILYSNHSETNKYFAWPIAVFKGVVESLPDKDENGKAIELEGEGAFAQYLTWDSAPESVKLENQNIDTALEMFTGTPFITMERMGVLGTYSGIALKMLFMPAHLKSAEKEAIFGKGIQRRLNYLKSVLCEINQSLQPALNMSIKPKFTYFLPQNILEEIDILVKAKGAGIISQESAINQNPIITDGIEEFEKIKGEKEAAAPVPPIVKEGDPLKIAS